MSDQIQAGNLKIGQIVAFRFSDNLTALGIVIGTQQDLYQILHLEITNKLDKPFTVIITRSDLVSGHLPGEYACLSQDMSSCRPLQIQEPIGQLSRKKIDEVIREFIHSCVSMHFHAVHKTGQDFIPGDTYIRYAGRVYDDKEMRSLTDATLDFWLTEGRFAKEFQKELTNFIGAKYCSLTNSGSSANLLAISALTSEKLGDKRLKQGDEVITVACSFPTTVTPIVQNRLIPVFCDVSIGTYNIVADEIENAMSDKTRAIFLAHTLGNPFDIDIVVSQAEKYNLWLIEDNCDSLGSTYKERQTGTFGHISTFSFFPPHHMTMGEGGALITNDIKLKHLINSFRDWGRDCWCDTGHDNTCGKRFDQDFGGLPRGFDHKFVYSHLGYNLKITDLQASIGVQQIKKLPFFIKARKENWNKIYSELRQQEEYFYLPKATAGSDPSWFGFALTVRENAPFSRLDIVTFLENHRIATRTLFSGNIIYHPCFKDVKYRVNSNLTNTDIIMNQTFWIGVYPGLTDAMLDHVIDTIKTFCRRYG